jgi:hypothetical protein
MLRYERTLDVIAWLRSHVPGWESPAQARIAFYVKQKDADMSREESRPCTAWCALRAMGIGRVMATLLRGRVGEALPAAAMRATASAASRRHT